MFRALICIIFLSGCASTPDGKSLLETLEFDENECGCFRATANFGPTFSPGTNASATLYKRKSCAGEEAPPTC